MPILGLLMVVMGGIVVVPNGWVRLLLLPLRRMCDLREQPSTRYSCDPRRKTHPAEHTVFPASHAHPNSIEPAS